MNETNLKRANMSEEKGENFLEKTLSVAEHLEKKVVDDDINNLYDFFDELSKEDSLSKLNKKMLKIKKSIIKNKDIAQDDVELDLKDIAKSLIEEIRESYGVG